MIYWHHDDLTVPLAVGIAGIVAREYLTGFTCLRKVYARPAARRGLALPSCKSAWGRRWMGARCVIG